MEQAVQHPLERIYVREGNEALTDEERLEAETIKKRSVVLEGVPAEVVAIVLRESWKEIHEGNVVSTLKTHADLDHAQHLMLVQQIQSLGRTTTRLVGVVETLTQLVLERERRPTTT